MRIQLEVSKRTTIADEVGCRLKMEGVQVKERDGLAVVFKEKLLTYEIQYANSTKRTLELRRVLRNDIETQTALHNGIECIQERLSEFPLLQKIFQVPPRGNVFDPANSGERIFLKSAVPKSEPPTQLPSLWLRTFPQIEDLALLTSIDNESGPPYKAGAPDGLITSSAPVVTTKRKTMKPVLSKGFLTGIDRKCFRMFIFWYKKKKEIVFFFHKQKISWRVCNLLVDRLELVGSWIVYFM